MAQLNSLFPPSVFSAKDYTNEERQCAINWIVNDCVSPIIIGLANNIPASTVREWMKKSGHKLPSKYKVTIPVRIT